jgi:predicted transcriptional regulator
MGAINFSYVNRCVVITDDDYNFGNIPTLGDYANNSRNYPSKFVEYDEIKDVKEFLKTIKPIQLHNIVLTSGYYEDACIDFVRDTEKSAMDCTGWSCNYNYDTINEIIGYIANDYNITAEDIKTLIQKRMDAMYITAETDEDEFQSFYEYLMDDIDEKIIQNEMAHCNHIIDIIKKIYGYKEIYSKPSFCMGEAI